MKKKLIILGLIIVLGLNVVALCRNYNKKINKRNVPKQFEQLNKESLDGIWGDLIIIRHKETGKRFIIYGRHIISLD